MFETFYNPLTPPKIPRLTKSVAENHIAMALGVPPFNLRFEKLPESPSVWRHACVPAGVVILNKQVAPYPTAQIDFTVCPACGKVLYYYEEQIMPMY